MLDVICEISKRWNWWKTNVKT